MYKQKIFDIFHLVNENGVFLNTAVIFISLILIIFTILLYLMNLGIISAIPIALFVFFIIFVNPEVGIIITFAVQLLDVTFNPSYASGLNWLSPGRILSFISVLSYIFNKLFNPKFSIHKSKYVVWLFICFGIWNIVCIPLSNEMTLGIWTAFKIFVNVGFVFASVDLLSKQKLNIQMLTMIMLGVLLGSIIIIFGTVTYRVPTGRLAVHGIGIEAIALSIGVGIISTISLIVLNPSKIKIFIGILSIIVMYYVAIQAGTRSVLVGILPSLFLAGIITYWKQLLKLVNILLITICFSIILYMTLNSHYITGKLSDRVTSIFKTDTYKENVRWVLWKVGLNTYIQNPLGVGPGNEPIYFEKNSQKIGYLHGESHNIFISILIESNPIGLLLYTFAIIILFINCIKIKNSSYRFASLLVLIFVIFQMLKISDQTSRVIWQPLTISMILLETEWNISRSKVIQPHKI